MSHGAHVSLRAKNTMGKIPIDLARIFGPHPEAEAMLGAAMLDRNFHSRYMLRRGSVEHRKLAASGADEAPEDAESTTDPLGVPHDAQAASLNVKKIGRGKDKEKVRAQLIGAESAVSVECVFR